MLREGAGEQSFRPEALQVPMSEDREEGKDFREKITEDYGRKQGGKKRQNFLLLPTHLFFFNCVNNI